MAQDSWAPVQDPLPPRAIFAVDPSQDRYCDHETLGRMQRAVTGPTGLTNDPKEACKPTPWQSEQAGRCHLHAQGTAKTEGLLFYTPDTSSEYYAAAPTANVRRWFIV